MMSDEIFLNVPEVIRTYNVSRSVGTTTQLYTASVIIQTAVPSTPTTVIFPIECVGLILLILTTVIGNTLVLAALFLDKRLHTSSFFLIANMAIADVLLGIFVLPFSSALELLNDRWIFGSSLCSAWLALDVLCCTASIIALMAVSIDRYIGVTRPLSYSSIMSYRRTIYLIIIVWAVSILTSVVPLFGLTDRGQKPKDITNSSSEPPDTCKVNKNTFYTIFSSLISFYIPVIILLILYSRVYQEAKKQGKKLENEKRRLYEMDYQIAAKNAQQQQQQQQHNEANGHVPKAHIPSNPTDDNRNDASTTLLNHENMLDEESSIDRTLTATDGIQLRKDFSKVKNKPDDDTSHSGSSIVASTTKPKSGSFRKRLFSTIKRNSLLHISQPLPINQEWTPNDELLLIKRKLHNLKREQKAFRTVGLILGALLICWLPFFVTLPVMSILKHHGVVKDENSENTWFKIAFWLGYCNSALNPFVYAFSNRAIRRAFREVICRRCCCCFCPKTSNQSGEQRSRRRQRAHSGSLTTDISQILSRGPNSCSIDAVRPTPKTEDDLDSSPHSTSRVPTTAGPVVSFADFLAETEEGDDISLHDDKQLQHKSIPASTEEHPSSTVDS